MKSGHTQRFKNWQNLCPASTRFLSSLVDARLTPALGEAGFNRVDVSLGHSDAPASGSSIEFERWAPTWVDSVTINFDKYHAPRFQVHGSRRLIDSANTFVRSANLVIRASQYLHFWGKPWWMPNAFWTRAASLRTAGAVERDMNQLLRFLETGERSPRSSRAIE
jgi:hypothetical protein